MRPVAGRPIPSHNLNATRFPEARPSCRASSLYERWLADQHHLLSALDRLAGRDLVCFCAPRLCHGDLLLRLANTTREARIAWSRAMKAAT